VGRCPSLLKAGSLDFSVKSALPVPEKRELSRCSVLNLLLMPCLIRFQKCKDRPTPRDCTTPNNKFQNVSVLDEYQEGYQLSSSNSSEN